MMKFAYAGLLLVSLLAHTSGAVAASQDEGEDLWGDEDWSNESISTSPWQVSGFLEAGYGQFTQSNVTDSNASLAEFRSQLDIIYSVDWYSINAKGDLYADDVIEEIQADMRELNIAFSALDNNDIVIGRQIITWGTGDYLFLNDLFAKDWQSFFAGRDDVYLKAPNDAVRVLHYFDDMTFDFVYSPEFTPDNYLTGERFSFYSPFEQGIIAPDNFEVSTTDKAQYSMRLATTINGVEYALYGYKGFWTSPVGVISQGLDIGQAYFPQLNSYGASLRTPAFSGLFNAEFSVYNSIEDSDGSNPFIANDQVRFLVGYEQELAADITGGVQFYLEHTQDYHKLESTAPQPDTLVDENRQVLTFRLTHLSYQQTLTSSLFLFYSLTDIDAYIKPSISYRYDDNWQFSSGANIFVAEKSHTFFGQHENNSNLWLRVRYSY